MSFPSKSKSLAQWLRCCRLLNLGIFITFEKRTKASFAVSLFTGLNRLKSRTALSSYFEPFIWVICYMHNVWRYFLEFLQIICGSNDVDLLRVFFVFEKSFQRIYFANWQPMMRHIKISQIGFESSIVTFYQNSKLSQKVIYSWWISRTQIEASTKILFARNHPMACERDNSINNRKKKKLARDVFFIFPTDT